MTAAAFDLLLVDAHLATMRRGAEPYGAIRDGAVGVRGGAIAWVGRARDLPRDVTARQTRSCGGRWLTPGLVDCHTHLVYAGNRAGEFERRLLGATYADIAREGGGISATVRATRAASAADLAAQSRPRLAALAAEGVTTVEIKSGYGLDTATELKQLRSRARWAKSWASTCARRCSPRMRCRRSSPDAPTTTSTTSAAT